MTTIKKEYENDERLIICANVDTHLFFSTGSENADAEYIQNVTFYLFNAETRQELSKPVFSIEKLNQLFAEDKVIVVVRDYNPIICDILNPDDYRNF